jgi:16S rRNA (adenine1518-N6/adenine1519-N6)-dimethyltransferase
MIDLLLGRDVPDGMYVTIQAEVAERIGARPGTKAYGLLSILMQSTGSVEILRKIKPTAFWPMPNVQSAMVVWRKDPSRYGAIKDIRVFKHVIDMLLGQRRKKIKNCLPDKETGGNILERLRKAQVDPDARGETIEPAKYVHLANLLVDYSSR